MEEMDGAVVGGDDELPVRPLRVSVSADQKLQRKLFEDVIVENLEIISAACKIDQ